MVFTTKCTQIVAMRSRTMRVAEKKTTLGHVILHALEVNTGKAASTYHSFIETRFNLQVMEGIKERQMGVQ